MRHVASKAVFVVAMLGAAAHAATITVTNTNDSGAGSLRQAILAANATGDPDTIAFAIPGIGPHTIAPASRLPDLQGVLTIDGYTQPGSRANALSPDQGGLDTVLTIEIHGPGNGFGFVLDTNPAADVTLRGIALNAYAPHIGGGNANTRLTVHGSFIGTTIDGTAAVTAGMACISVAGNAQIGGTQPAQRNLIANCGNSAVGAGNGNVVIEGNLIGTDVTGTQALQGGTPGNAGIVVNAGANATPRLRIGGSTAASRNVISGHPTAGIGVYGVIALDDYLQWEIRGNYIGTDVTGTRAIPNGSTQFPQFTGGIVFNRVEASNAPAILGGFGPGDANLIAHNHGAGILTREARPGESFDNRGNAIHHNRGTRGANIDIAPAGPSPNDPGDPDAGANNRQNAPQIVAANVTGNQLSITYLVDAATNNATYPLRIDFYENIQGGSGALLGQDSYPAASAQQSRTIVLTLPPGMNALPFVAVATDAAGYSSEFSGAYDVIFQDDFD